MLCGIFNHMMNRLPPSRAPVSRRALLLGGVACAILPVAAWAQADPDGATPAPYYDPSLLPPLESPTDFPITPANLKKIQPQFRRQMVAFEGAEFPGTIIIDPDHRFLYYVMENQTAIRYGVGVGRQGFAWNGAARVGMKRRWPRWLPPPEMVQRDENARKWANGMPGGPDNPLGARAMYLYANGVDTMYRIHGTNDPSSIGKAMSSGCIRMLNEDIAALYLRVPVGSQVIVRPSTQA
jgi:lipoprotein-anchoring transpeptidase ErfK/SrfK